MFFFLSLTKCDIIDINKYSGVKERAHSPTDPNYPILTEM